MFANSFSEGINSNSLFLDLFECPTDAEEYAQQMIELFDCTGRQEMEKDNPMIHLMFQRLSDVILRYTYAMKELKALKHN